MNDAPSAIYLARLTASHYDNRGVVVAAIQQAGAKAVKELFAQPVIKFTATAEQVEVIRRIAGVEQIYSDPRLSLPSAVIS